MNDAYMRTAVMTSIFCAAASALYVIADAQPSPIVEWFSLAGPTLAVILWLERDAARTGVGSVHDLGFLLCYGWPIVLPWYALKTRGRAGWSLMLLLYTLAWSAYLGALVGLLCRFVA